MWGLIRQIFRRGEPEPSNSASSLITVPPPASPSEPAPLPKPSPAPRTTHEHDRKVREWVSRNRLTLEPAAPAEPSPAPRTADEHDQKVREWVSRNDLPATSAAPPKPALTPRPADEHDQKVRGWVSQNKLAPEPAPEPPTPSTKPKNRALVIDCETTGLHPGRDRIVSFAAIEIIDHVPSGNVINLIFNPGQPSHPAALRVHGLSDWLLQHQNPFKDYARAIAEWMEDALIIGHNVYFDLDFLRAEFGRVGLPKKRYDCLCTMQLYREEYPRAKASLDAACRRYGINAEGRAKHHGAFVDAALTYELYWELAIAWRLREYVPVPKITPPPPSNYVEPPSKPRARRKKTPEPVPQVGEERPENGGDRQA